MRIGIGLSLTQSPTDEGGGGEPEWVTEGANIDIDFVGGSPQARAYVDGAGEVAVDTLLGSDPNSDMAWGASTVYDPARLVADGYDPRNGNVAPIGALRTKLLAGSTIRIALKQTGVGSAVQSFLLLSADGGQALQFDANQNDLDLQCFSYGGSFAEDILDIINFDNPSEGATNVIALTVMPTRAEGSCNASAAFAAVLDENDFPTVGENPLVCGVFTGSSNSSGSAGVFTYQRITVFDALPSTAGLPELAT